MNRNKYGGRFLLPRAGHGNVRWLVEARQTTEGTPYQSGELVIGDCSRTVHLGFYSGNRQEAKNNLAKINRLIGELEKFRAEIEFINEEFNK